MNFEQPPPLPIVFDDRSARTWCEALAQSLRVHRIRPAGAPYLDRYYAAGWNPFTKVSAAQLHETALQARDHAHETLHGASGNGS